MPDLFISLLIVCPLVFLAGFVDAAAGGGGLISLPAYLLAGLPPHLASGTNKASALCGTTAALLRYQKSGKILWKAALPATIAALPGAYLGAQLQMLLDADILRLLLALLLPVLGVILLRRPNLAPKRPLSLSPAAVSLVCILVGFVIGLYDGFLGPGTGTFLILCFTFFCGMDVVSASGSAKVVNLASNIAAMIAFALRGEVLYALALPAALCAIAGGALGAHLAVRRGIRFIKPVIFGVLGLLVVRLAYDLVQGLM